MFDPKKFKNKKACVLGAGKSGIAVAKLLKRRGFKILLSEETYAETPSSLKGVEIETGGHSSKIFECDFMVKSPGISHNHKIIKRFKKLGKPIFSELEIALAFAPKNIKVFAITGTNGKTTTTNMLAAIMRQYVKSEGKGRKVYMTGNVGKPLSEVADKIKAGSIIVVEVSSYQLEDSSYFRPDVSAVLNITPDHLEHHGSLKNYINAKSKIFKSQAGAQTFVTNGSDTICVRELKEAKCKVLTFSSSPKHSGRSDIFYDGDEMIFACGHRIRPPSALLGVHNVENAMAAALMSLAGGVPAVAIQRAFNKFNALEHRIEFFAEYKGIKCYNDSKSTNVDSTAIALKSLQSANKIWLILGGRDKGFPYNPLIPLLKKHCKEAVLIGEATQNIKRALNGHCRLADKGDIYNAVKYIFEKAAVGDILLLSPACASFDQFKNFEERGEKFKDAVYEYIRKNP
ncbi:MAG: UDP-N-acetylmuramoyl-L-alanine--D-glutamate ligase [Elusimicrobiota bacterium]|jgi:UDP-N-acetylmuramoylalanine--D-glutamate ligase|nr:UDP-N-acetylmuramoyl-L-alanine--D-glutamate ligase [Elusimicrobiota bacterium]